MTYYGPIVLDVKHGIDFLDDRFERMRIYERITAMNLVYFPTTSLDLPTKPVTDFNTDKLKNIITEMKNVMSYHDGIGLAANQIGRPYSIIIVKDNKDEVHTFINPLILESSGSVVMKEGCLSAPNIHLNIKRAESVVLQYQDILGEFHKIAAEGRDARVILHEMEHLQGKNFLSHVNRIQRKTFLSQLKKYLKNNVA